MAEDNDVFAQALKAQKELQAEVEQKKNYVPGEYEETEYCVIEHAEKAIRPVGNPFDPHTLKSKNETDVHVFMQSQFVKDDGKGYVKINWPAKIKTSKKGVSIEPDPDFILTKLFNKVMERKWSPYPEGKKEIRNGRECTGEYIYPNKSTKTYERLEKNGSRGEYTKASPSAFVMMNVIDRSDNWCVENKHTKVLINKMGKGESKKDEKTGQMITPSYPSAGVSYDFYCKLLEKSVQISKGWNKDFIVKKTGEGLNTKYLSIPATPARVDEGDITAEAFATAKEDGMPSDWIMYNLSKRTTPSSAFKIKKNLEQLFKMFDAEFNEHLFDELNEIVKIEQEEYEKAHPKTEAEQNLSEQVKAQAETIKAEEKVAEIKPVERTRTASVPEKSIEDQCKDYFPKFNELSDEDKGKLVKAITKFGNDGLPIWDEKSEPSPCSEKGCYYKGTSIQTNFPFAMKKCPVCGTTYD